MCDAVWFDDGRDEAWRMGDLAEILPVDEWVRREEYDGAILPYDPELCLCSVDLPATLAKVGYVVTTDENGWINAKRVRPANADEWERVP